MSRKTSAPSGGDKITASHHSDIWDETRQSSYLMAYADGTLKVKVNEGKPYFGGNLVEFSGGYSPEISDTAASSRIDIVSLESSSVLKITEGVEADNPEMPDIPTNEIPICAVYMRNGATEIKDEDDATNGYIYKDLRPFVKIASEPANYSDVKDSRDIDGTVYQNTTKKWLKIIISLHTRRKIEDADSAAYIRAFIGATSSPASEVAIVGAGGQVAGGTGMGTEYGTMTFLVPPDWYYKVGAVEGGANKTASLRAWWEVELPFPELF